MCLRWAKINQCELFHYLCPMLLPSDSRSEPPLGEVLQWECCLENSLLWGFGGTCRGETCWAWLCSSWSSQPNSLSKVVFGCLIFVSWLSVFVLPFQIQRKRRSSVSIFRYTMALRTATVLLKDVVFTFAMWQCGSDVRTDVRVFYGCKLKLLVVQAGALNFELWNLRSQWTA